MHVRPDEPLTSWSTCKLSCLGSVASGLWLLATRPVTDVTNPNTVFKSNSSAVPYIPSDHKIGLSATGFAWG